MTIRSILAGLACLLALLSASETTADTIHYAQHTPGFRAYLEAGEHLQAGRYFRARHSLKRAAHWADKLAQHNLGVMYYHGHGVDQDPARAWAWFELAAERRYPDMVAAARAVFQQLGETEQVKARAILEEELLPEYGDAVAVERTHQRMQQALRRPRSARGTKSPHQRIVDQFGQVHLARDYYDPKRWDFHHVIEQEMILFDAMPRGRVDLRDMAGVDPEHDESEEK